MVRIKMQKISWKVANPFKNINRVFVSHESIFFVSFTLYIIMAFLKTTMITEFVSVHLLNYGAYLAVALLALNWLLFSEFEVRTFVIDIIVLTVTLVSWVRCGDPLGFYMALFVIEARDMNFDKILKWYLVVVTSLFVMVVLLSHMEVVRNLTYLRDDHVRQAFGIVYPTDFASHFFYLLLAYCYFFYKKMGLLSYILIACLAAMIYVSTDARLDTILIILIIPTIMIVKRTKWWGKSFILKCSWMVTGIFAYVTTVVIYMYNGKGFLSKLNDLFSSRVSLAHRALDKFGISFFGQKIKENGWGGKKGFQNFRLNGQLQDYFMIDSSFARVFLIYGILTLIILIIGVSYLSIKAIKQKSYILVGILWLVAVSCLIDQHMLEMAYNPFFLAIFAEIGTKKVIQTKILESENYK